MPVSFCSLQLVWDRSRADEYLQQSLRYLEDAQPSLRKEAVRFIGEQQPPRSLFWQPGPSPRRCAGTSVLGSRGSDPALCLGLAKRSLRSKEEISRLCSGE